MIHCFQEFELSMLLALVALTVTASPAVTSEPEIVASVSPDMVFSAMVTEIATLTAAEPLTLSATDAAKSVESMALVSSAIL